MSRLLTDRAVALGAEDTAPPGRRLRPCCERIASRWPKQHPAPPPAPPAPLPYTAAPRRTYASCVTSDHVNAACGRLAEKRVSRRSNADQEVSLLHHHPSKQVPRNYNTRTGRALARTSSATTTVGSSYETSNNLPTKKQTYGLPRRAASRDHTRPATADSSGERASICLEPNNNRSAEVDDNPWPYDPLQINRNAPPPSPPCRCHHHAAPHNNANQDPAAINIPAAPYWLVLMSVNTVDGAARNNNVPPENTWSALCPEVVDRADIWELMAAKTTIAGIDD